jgi:hypothetical protein
MAMYHNDSFVICLAPDESLDQVTEPHLQGCPLPRTIEDAQLVFDENGLGDYGTDAARTQKPGENNDYVDEQHDEIAYFLIVTNLGIAWS